MKKILIPTDFTIQSLNAVHAAIANYNGEMQISLLHLLRMPQDIPDLLFPSMRNRHLDMVSKEFKEACEVLENCYSSRIKRIYIKFGFGSTTTYIKDLLEGEQIDTIFFCPDIQLSLPSSRSVEMLSLLKRTKCPMESVPYKKIKQEQGLADIAMLKGTELKIPKTKEDYATEE